MRRPFATLLSLACLAPAFAQKGAPAVSFALPQAPTLSGPPTLGMQRGTMAEFTLPGTNLADAVSIYTTAPGVTAIVHPGQTDPTKVKVTLAATKDGPIGLFQLRVATKHGVSNFRPFCLDDLPEVARTGDVSKKEKAQVLAGPCVVTGTAAVEVADYYKVSVKPGQKLMLEVLARRIGTPCDPVIILHDAKTLRELPALYADDTPGLQGDCRLSLPSKDAGEYLVEVRDMTYQGSANHGYRLRFGEFPAATTAFPLAVWGNQRLPNGFAGPNLEGVSPPGEFAAPGFALSYLTPRRAAGSAGWPVPVRRTSFPAGLETEPNDTPETANPLSVPGGVSAGFGKKGDRDHFRFAAKKGVKYVVEAATAELGAPTEVYVRILDKAGKELVASDPQKVTARVEVTPAEDGPLVIACEHLLYLSGPNEVYFLTVKEATPDFEITVGTDRIDVPVGGVAPLAITGLTRLNGYAGPVHLVAVTDVDLTATNIFVMQRVFGSVVIPAGVTPTPEKPVVLPVKMGSGTKPGPKDLWVVGCDVTDEVKDRPWEKLRLGTVADGVKASLANLSYTPAEMHGQLALGVYSPRFTLSLPTATPITLKPGEKATVKVKRDGDLKSEVALTAVALPANVTMKPATLKADAKDVDIELTADAKAPGGFGRLVVRGQVVKPKGKEKDPDYAVFGVGAEITVDAAPAKKEPAKKK